MQDKQQIIVVTPEELKQLINEAVMNALRELLPGMTSTWEPAKDQDQVIKGIHALAAFLHCSPSHAQKLKNSGILPYFQRGKTVLFDKAKVMAAMKGGQK